MSTLAAAPRPQVAPRLQAYFDEYASFHKHPMNQLTHYLAIPVIVFTLFGLMAKIPWSIPINSWLRIDGGLLLWAGATAWLMTLDWKHTIPFALLMLPFYFLSRDVPQLPLWIAFGAAWVVQFIGHLGFEKNSPAFYKNFEQLFIGPFWIFAKAVGWWKPAPG